VKFSKVVGVKKSGHKLKAPFALLGLVLSIVVIPMSAAHADPWKTIGSGPLRLMTKDQAGNIYVANYGEDKVSKISPAGDITDFGPTGSGPRGIAVDSLGNIYTANAKDGTVSKITPATNYIKKDFGVTGPNSRPYSLVLDKVGNIYTANSGNNTISKITSTGDSDAAWLQVGANTVPLYITIDESDNLYISDCGPRINGNLGDTPSNLINDVRKITPSKQVTILGATGQCPNNIAFDSSGNIYTSNYGASFGWNISKITPVGISTIFSDTGDYPYGIAIDPLGNLYTPDYDSKTVSKITPTGCRTILGSTGSAGPRGIVYSSGNIYTANEDGTVSKFAVDTTTSCSAPRSKIATIDEGVTTVAIYASAALPATTINFGGTTPSAVTLVPVASNPASVAATPFTISGSTKIVDIQISGTFTGSATVCLDGASTDHLFHYTGTPAAWVELGSRSYANGQVCGVTTSFSPFAAAPPVPVALVAAPVPVPDPVQQSKITALSVATAIAGTATPVEITGSFIEKIRAIQINGVALAAGSWTQTASSVAFTMPGKSAGTYQIQIFNGSAPVLKVQNFTFTTPIVVVAPTPTPTVKPKVTYIRCAKPGHGTRVAYGVNPTCPAGYVKK
jgi:streptogramin lyase